MKVKPNKKSGDVIVEINRKDEPLLRAAAAIPFQINRILVPIDFSDCSKKALQYALPLANAHHARVTVLYVVPNAIYTEGFGGVLAAEAETQMRKGAENELSKFVRNLIGDCEIESRVEVGSPANEIINVAKSLMVDLLIVSTHGYTGLKHVFLGSVAEHIVRHAPCPVLVVREQERDLELMPDQIR